MNEILIALLIGIVAGIIDIIPMIIQKMNKYANLSAGGFGFDYSFCSVGYFTLVKRCSVKKTLHKVPQRRHKAPRRKTLCVTSCLL